MQHPTCENVRIRSTADAHKIFSAVQQGLLQMVTRRLDADERIALRSGCVYAWEERGPHSELTGLGIERFTEGRRWSPSRVRDEFLFYYEKYTPPPDANQLGNPPERQPPRDWDPLVKQTYSVWVETDKGRRKWHLTAYFTQATIDQLGTIDDNPIVRDLVVPEGTFKSTRVGKSRSSRSDDNNRSDAARAATGVPRTYSAFPTPYQYQARNGSPSMTPIPLHEPYSRPEQRSPVHEHSPSPVSPPSNRGTYLTTHNTPYSDSNGASTSYPGQPYPVGPPPISQSPSPSNLGSRYPINPVSHPDHRPHESSRPSPGSWDENQRSAYTRPVYQDDQRQNIHVTFPPSSSPSTYAPSVDYSVTAASHAYTSPGSGIPPLSSSHGNSSTYSPSYSLHTTLTLSEVDSRTHTLSPLQIPDRLPGTMYGPHAQAPSRVQPHIPPDMERPVEDTEDMEGSLAPLELLRRPQASKFRREPMDEKTLRLLDEKRSSP